MVDLEILKERGGTPERLREIFTCTKRDDPNWKIKERFERSISDRINEGLRQCARTSAIYQAIDMAWDSTPIQKESVPLLLYAQGKIDLPRFVTRLNELKLTDDYCKKNEKGEITGVDLPKLVDVRLNLVRSYVTRRLAAQSSRYANLYPYFRYEPRSTSNVGKARADVLSQRVDIMTDQYGYRHLGDQCARDMFLYSHTVVVPNWDRKVQWRKVNDELTAKVVKEGVDWRKPHPSRIFWDRSAPLANINTDTGPAWIADWDIVRFGSLPKTDFFNMTSVKASDALQQTVATYADFFQYYFDPKVISLPEMFSIGAASNDRSLQGFYSSEDDDKGIVLTRMAIRIVPSDEGICDYPYPVWMRLTVASDSTVVHGEFLPSLPACYGGINEHDDRLVNPSFAMELLPYQDAGTNILTHLLLHMKASLFQLWAIDTDAIDENVKKSLTAAAKGANYFQEPQLLWYSASKYKDLGINIDQAIRVIKADMKAEINAAFGQLLQLLSVCDRLMVMSQNEIGQAAPREISAREVTEISATTDSVYSFIGNGIDELRAAMKLVCYESLVTQASEDVCVPVVGSYTKKTLRLAGFDDLAEDEETDETDSPKPRTVIGSARKLEYEYLFSSRDGAERGSNPQAAQVLTQLAQHVIQFPPLAQKMGLERLFDLYNEIFRLSGAGFDLRLELKEGEDGEIPTEQQGAPQGGEGQPDLQAILAGLNERIAQLESQAGGAPGQPEGMPAALMQP